MVKTAKQKSSPPAKPKSLRAILKQLWTSIGTRIVLPYLLLTLGIGGVGAFIVIRLVTGSWQERYHNQLLDTGRVVSETMVTYEEERLAVLRAVVATVGVADSLAANESERLADLVPQIIANSNTDAVELLDKRGQEIYGWQRPPNQNGGNIGDERVGADFSPIEDVRLVLNGFVDGFGEKRIFLSQTPYGMMLFTIGPVYRNDELVGAAMVGSYLSEMVTGLSENAAARVTLYDPHGNVIETSFAGGQQGAGEILQESPQQYTTVRTLLRESPNRYPVVVTKADSEVPLRRLEILGQEYSLAYGDWRLRDQSFGLFSVGLPTTFIVSTAATSRNVLSIMFAIATVAVFAVGFSIAQRIIRPIRQLVNTSVAVSQGDLSQRTGIQRSDEIGSLAQSFDIMTEHLIERNRQLVAQASKLEAILDSTTDGIVVIDQQGVIITTNPTARKILTEVSSDFLADILREIPLASNSQNGSEKEQALAKAKSHQPQRYEAGDYVFSALTDPVVTPDGEELGTVITLRDVTREAEAEQLKDGFITNVSHELRTPLAAIMGNAELLQLTAGDSLNERQVRYIHTINQSSNKLLRHINQIIDISQIQGGVLRLGVEKLNIVSLVDTTANKWREQIEDKKLSFRVILAETELWVDGDQSRLSWAIDNLISNAYNYTLTGTITVHLFQENGEVRLDVSDTGVGIAISDQPYLFTRFFRATPHKSMYEVSGVGLGLFIARSLVELHGGRIWFDSELDVGSTFSLAVPLLEPEPEIR